VTAKKFVAKKSAILGALELKIYASKKQFLEI